MSAITTTTERPILFSGPMVRAILSGTKTQTRRVVKPTKYATLQNAVPGVLSSHYGDLTGQPCLTCNLLHDVGLEDVISPYGYAGTHLWVRETWQARSPVDLEWSVYKPTERPGYAPDDWKVRYAATDENFAKWSGWNPSIHMPRWASRLTLEVTGVRVERVQSISECDAMDEGTDYLREFGQFYRSAFAQLWDSINRTRPGCAWADNPWVWVVEFRRVEP